MPFLAGHLDLADSFELILDGVFDRDDVLLRGVDPVQIGVETGALAAAGGPGDEDYAVGKVQQCVELLEIVGPEPQFIQTVHARALVEDTQHAALAEAGRNGAHAQIDLALAQANAGASVLRHSPLGDVHARHDLDTRDNQRQDVAVEAQHIVQDAVDPVADLNLRLVRVHVDIAGPHLQGAEQDIVHQPDHRRAVHHVEQIVGARDLVDQLVEILRIQLLGDLLDHRASLLIGGVDHRRDGRPRGEGRPDRQMRHFRDVVQHVGVQRLGKHDRQLAAALFGPDPDQMMMLGIGGRDILNELRGDLLVRYLRQKLPVERLGKQLEDHVFGVVGTREQNLIQPASALVFVEVPGQLLGVEQPRSLGSLYE